jgi:hypothetical protein|nr:MAG TPA: protein of unknown function (DUF4376) [Caudoviricetes sp.]
MSDFQIGQIFENEYPPQAASFCSENNATIQLIESVQKTVQSHTLEGKQAYAVFTDGSKIKLWPYNKQKYAVGQTVNMKRYKIVEIPAPSIDELKTAKLAQLEAAYLQWRNADAYLISSLGFPADSDERANTDVNALVYSLEEKPEEARGTTIFRGYDNKFYPLTLEQLKTLKSEIGDNGQYSYQQKWAYEDAIKNATSKEELDAIEIVFQPLDATKETE